jgi:hypothetical protein
LHTLQFLKNTCNPDGSAMPPLPIICFIWLPTRHRMVAVEAVKVRQGWGGVGLAAAGMRAALRGRRYVHPQQAATSRCCWHILRRAIALQSVRLLSKPSQLPRALSTRQPVHTKSHNRFCLAQMWRRSCGCALHGRKGRALVAGARGGRGVGERVGFGGRQRTSCCFALHLIADDEGGAFYRRGNFVNTTF